MQVLETRTDAAELGGSLRVLPTFYAEHTPAARRGLRGSVERRGLAINEEFLEASAQAQQALGAVELELEGLARCCERIAGALSASRASTSELVSETAKLRHELESNERRSALVEPHFRQDALQSMLADPGGPAHQDFMRAFGYFD